MKVEWLRWNIYVNPDVMYKIMMGLRQVLCNKNDLFPCQVWRQIWLVVRSCVRACVPERARVGWMGVCTLIGYLISSVSVQPKILVWIPSEWNSISRNFRKRGQLCEVYRNFRKIVFHFTSSEFTEFSFECSVFSEIQQFSDFLEALRRFEIHWLKFCLWNTLIGQWTELCWK